MMHSYNVKMVAQTLGISPHTLRAWERRYSAITPERSATGRRQYSQKEVERLRLLVLLLQRGHHIGNVARLPDDELSNLLEKSHELVTPSIVDEAEVPQVKVTDAERHVAYLLGALSNYRVSDIAQELEWARLALGARDLVLKVLVPLLGQVGQLVFNRRLSVAQEHVLSSIIRDQIGQILQILPNYRRPSLIRNREGILLTTPEGELHEFGILMGTILCAHYYLSAYYLGPNLPSEPLVEAAQALHAKVVVIGTTELTLSQSNLAQYVTSLDNSLSRDVEIWIGGEASQSLGDLQGFHRKVRLIPTLDAFDRILKERGTRTGLN